MICIPSSKCPQYVLGKILIPVTWLLGVDPSECEVVGKLIGLKMTINEFVAYKQMGDLIKEGKLNVSVVRSCIVFYGHHIHILIFQLGALRVVEENCN